MHSYINIYNSDYMPTHQFSFKKEIWKGIWSRRGKNKWAFTICLFGVVPKRKVYIWLLASGFSSFFRSSRCSPTPGDTTWVPNGTVPNGFPFPAQALSLGPSWRMRAITSRSPPVPHSNNRCLRCRLLFFDFESTYCLSIVAFRIYNFIWAVPKNMQPDWLKTTWKVCLLSGRLALRCQYKLTLEKSAISLLHCCVVLQFHIHCYREVGSFCLLLHELKWMWVYCHCCLATPFLLFNWLID